jgi:serine/threonine-protein kinase
MPTPEHPRGSGADPEPEFTFEEPADAAPPGPDPRRPAVAGTATPPPYCGTPPPGYPAPNPYATPYPGAYPPPGPRPAGYATPPPGGAAYPSPPPGYGGYPSPPPGAYPHYTPAPGYNPYATPYPYPGAQPSGPGLPAGAVPPAVSAEIAPGTILDEKYLVIEKLGQGGMGAVYRARHKLLERDVAVKVIAPQLAQDPSFKVRFFREAKIAIEFVHRHAVPVREFGLTRDGLYYMTMDFSTGRSLRSVLEKEGPLEPARAARILRMVLEALAEAHRKKIVHRDLKPDNIMVEDQGGEDFVKVLDFGLAKLIADGESGPSLASGEAIIGTPAYMSPEQACGEEVDHRADLYSCGIVLYQLLTGKLPFQAASTRQIIMKQVSSPPPPFASVRPDLVLPDGLEAVVMKALAKERGDRFQTAEQFHYALERYAGEKIDLSGAARPSVPGGASLLPLDAASGATQEISGSLTGLTIDRYKIVAPIAEGGMGAVYRAVHELMHRECAFKVMKGDLAKDPEVLSRFQREAQVSAKFKHPSAVEIYDFGRMGDNMFFMAMELVKGRQLSERIAESRPKGMPLKDVVEIAWQLLDVLGAAHKTGIVHRDLKPENIMLQQAGDWPNQVKVLDFGIAKLQDVKGEAGKFKTQVGSFFGTPQYASPEQCGGEAVDARSDLYSTGIIIYEMLTGALPFVSVTAGGYLAQHMVAAPRRMSEANPEASVPAAVEEVVLRALEKKREKRFQTAQEFLEALSEAAGLKPAFEVGEHGVRLSPDAYRPPAHAGRKPLLALAVALAGAAGAIGFLLLHHRSAPLEVRLKLVTTPGLARVEVTGPDGKEAAAKTAPESGIVELADLAPGTYRVRVSKEGFDALEKEVTLDPGTTLELPLPLHVSREAARREAETARTQAARAQAAARAVEAEKLAPAAMEQAAKQLADAEAAFGEAKLEVARERYAAAADAFERARREAAAAAEEAKKVEEIAGQAGLARNAAEAALAREFAAQAFERAAADEAAGRSALEARDLAGARARLASAKALFEQARDSAIAGQEERVRAARAACERVRREAEEAGAAERAKELYERGRAKVEAAGAAEKAGKRPEAAADLRAAADLFAQALAAADERRAADAFARRIEGLLASVAVESGLAQSARESAEGAGAARLAAAKYEEARTRAAAATKAGVLIDARLAGGAAAVPATERAELAEGLAALASRWREVTAAFVEAERLARREGERERVLGLMKERLAEAMAAKRSFEEAVRAAEAKGADASPAQAKGSEAAAALEQAEAACREAGRPEAPADKAQTAGDLALQAARRYDAARALAEAAAPKPGDGGAAAQAAQAAQAASKAAVVRVLEAFKRAMESKDVVALKACFIDLAKTTENGYRSLFARPEVSVAVAYEPPIIDSDDEAHALFTLTISENGAPKPPLKAKLLVVRYGGGWKLERIDAGR